MADNLNILGAQFEDVTGIVATNTEEVDLLYTRGGGSSMDYDVVETTEDSVVLDDYVVEYGTSGIWRYRKWNSGVSECWAIYGTTVSSYATPWTGASAFTSSVTFPTGLFVATPNVNTDFICDSVLAISCGGLHTITTSGTSLYGISIGASGSQSCTWNIQVKGRWK